MTFGRSAAITSATPWWISSSRAVSEPRDFPRTTPASHNFGGTAANFQHAVAGDVQPGVDAEDAEGHGVPPRQDSTPKAYNTKAHGCAAHLGIRAAMLNCTAKRCHKLWHRFAVRDRARRSKTQGRLRGPGLRS